MKISNTAPIVILTGAGISKESGLDTFRGNGGLWEGIRVEEVASPIAFQKTPDIVHSFYNKRRERLLSPDIKPNAAHYALEKLEKEWPGEVLLVTQNVDDLHERAGSKNLIHMHGELLNARCVSCHHIFLWKKDMDTQSICPNCTAVGALRVNVVWFGEIPLMMDVIENALINAALFVSIGTSGNVYPAAGFVQVASRSNDARTIEINLEPSLNADQFSKGYYGPASETVPDFISKLLDNI